MLLHCALSLGLQLNGQAFPFSDFFPLMTPPLGTHHGILTLVSQRDMLFFLRLLLGFFVWYLCFGVHLLPLWVIHPFFVKEFHPLVFGCVCRWSESFLSRLLKLPPVLFVSTRFSPIIRNEPRCSTSPHPCPSLPSKSFPVSLLLLRQTRHYNVGISMKLINPSSA